MKVIKFSDFSINENENKTEHYMFRENLSHIKRFVDELLEHDINKTETILKEHDWIEDHITTAKTDIEQVFDFLTDKE